MKSRKKKKPASTKRKIIKKGVSKKRAVKRRAGAKKKIKKISLAKKPGEIIIGKITHYFPHVKAAVIKLKAPLKTGDTIKVKGHTTDFQQSVSSMQVDHVALSSAKKGQEIGLLVESRVRRNDTVLKRKT